MLKGIIVLVLLASCARQSEPILAPRSLLSESSLTLHSRLPEGGGGIDPEIRSISLVIFPTSGDMEGFEYAPNNEEVGAIWDSLGDYLPYGERLLRRYSKSMDGRKKLEKMVTMVVTMAELRSDVFRHQVPLRRQADTIVEGIKSENRALKNELKNISCYYEEVSEAGAYQCHSAQAQDEGLQHKVLSSCRNLSNHHFAAGDSPTVWEHLLNRCEALGREREARREILDRIEEYDYLRQEGEGVLLDVLLSAERHSGEKSFLALGVSKDRGDPEGRQSILGIASTAEDIRDLTLFLDFGENYSAGPGVREYSTANGRIGDVRMEKVGWADVLKFTLETVDFDIHASLSLTVQELSGVRFVGEIEVFYPDGKRSTGLMALELDRI